MTDRRGTIILRFSLHFPLWSINTSTAENFETISGYIICTCCKTNLIISVGVYVADVWPSTGVIPTLQHHLISLGGEGRESERYF